MYVLDEYPADAVGGADFVSAAAQRQILDVGPDGERVARRERVVVTDRFFDADELAPMGRACFSEQTVRSMGQLMGLFDQPQVARLAQRVAKQTAEIGQLEAENLALKAALRGLEDTALVRVVYVAPDGTEFASRPALDRYLMPVESVTPEVVTPFQEVQV